MAFYDDYFELEPDIFLLFNFLTIIFSALLIYKILQYYNYTGSKEFLVIGFVFLRYFYTNFVIIRVIYIEDFRVHFANQDSRYWDGFPYVLFWDISVALSHLFLLKHIYDLVDFDTRSKQFKWYFYFVVFTAITYLLFDITWGITKIIDQEWIGWTAAGMPEPYRWYMHVYYPQFIFPIHISRFFAGYLTYSLLIYAYVFVEPEHQTSAIKFSRIFWILYSVVQIGNFAVSNYIFHQLENKQNLDVDLIDLSFDVQNTLEFLSVTSLIFILIFFPQTLLISKSQLFQAGKLYSLVSKKAEVELNTGLPFISTQTSFAEYIKMVKNSLVSEEINNKI